MPTLKELHAAHKQELDAAFAAKYPEGQFTLQRYVGLQHYPGSVHGVGRWGLHWCPKRTPPGFGDVPRGITTYNMPDTIQTGRYGYEITQMDHRVGAIYGDARHFPSLATLLAAARKAGCADDLIAAFEARYHARATEGF